MADTAILKKHLCPSCKLCCAVMILLIVFVALNIHQTGTINHAKILQAQSQHQKNSNAIYVSQKQIVMLAI